MKLGELLNQVKIGEEEFKINKLITEIEEDGMEDDPLEEGVKYFRLSKRLNKLAERLSGKSAKVPEAAALAAKTKTAAQAFESIEKAFAAKTLTKQKAKQRLIAMKAKNKEILTMLRKKETLTALKVGGAIALAAGVAVAMYFGVGGLAALAAGKVAQIGASAGGVGAKVGAAAAGGPGFPSFTLPKPPQLPAESGFVAAAKAARKALGIPSSGNLDPTKIFGRGTLVPGLGK